MGNRTGINIKHRLNRVSAHSNVNTPILENGLRGHPVETLNENMGFSFKLNVAQGTERGSCMQFAI